MILNEKNSALAKSAAHLQMKWRLGGSGTCKRWLGLRSPRLPYMVRRSSQTVAVCPLVRTNIALINARSRSCAEQAT